MRFLRWAVVVGGLVVAGGTAPAVMAACPGEGASVRTAAVAATRTAVVCLVNEARTARGLAPMRADPRLDAAGQSHAQDMQDKDYFEHQAPLGPPLGDRVRAAGYAWGGIGENIAFGQETAFEVVQGWLGSPGHCVNILGPFNDIGVGISSRPYWVQDFAVPAGAAPAAGGGSCPAALGRSAPAGSGDPKVTRIRALSGVRRGIRFDIECATGCTVTSRIRQKAKAALLVNASVVVPRGTTRTVTVRLDPAGEARLRRSGRRQVRLEVIVGKVVVRAKSVLLPRAAG